MKLTQVTICLVFEVRFKDWEDCGTLDAGGIPSFFDGPAGREEGPAS